MAYTAGDVTRFEQAKALAAQLVKDARRGDALSVVLMADPPRVVIGDPSPNHAEVLKEIEEITLPHGGTDLAASFDAIDRVLDVSTIPQKEVVFLTDLQAASWRQAGGDDDGLKRALAKLEARQAAVGRHRPGQVRRREPRGDRPAARRADRHASDALDPRPTPRSTTSGPNRSRGSRVRLMVDGRLGPEQPPSTCAVGRGPAGRLHATRSPRRATTWSRSRSTTTRSSSTTAAGWPCRSASA